MPARSRRRPVRKSARRPRRRPRAANRIRWDRISDERLLRIRLKDLGVSVSGTVLETCVSKLYDELDQRGLRLKPHVWLSDEWFSPAGVPGFAAPFYLANARLRRLEANQLLDVEGASRAECLRIMRHEAGHAFQHAYQLHRRRKWQQLFGKSSTRYPEYYRPNPASKRYVQHLRLWYAQSHPDEDFAETFAVWLKPRSDWKRRYAGWPALKKLQYVDELMREIGPRAPLVANRRTLEPLNRLTKTLAEHYAARRKKYTVRLPNIYDADLRRLFSDQKRHRRLEMAATFLRRNRQDIRRLVARWTGEYQYTLDLVLGDMIARCRVLRLHAAGPERQLLTDFCVLLTVKTMHFLYSQGRKDWIAL
ncbi:MAG TPA: putative zinc-binding metallopeptidase [Gemmatimonadaceae bacterium]|nr:putative zinc-binding metallopeptidase [Gemmatimonadaceae bacterium]